jgi:hypothetical protein
MDAFQLRVGDMVLVAGEGKPAEVISRGRTYLSPIGVRLANGTERWFDSGKTGVKAIVAGARMVDGNWQPL